MNIKSFAKELKKKLMEHYKDKAIVEISDILKTNGKKEVGLSIIFTEAEDIAVPVIYIEGMYEHYKDNDYTMDDCVRQITELRDKLVYEECFENIKSILTSWDEAKKYVYPRLINTNDNQELLEDLISYPFLDLSVIFFLRDSAGESGETQSIKITKALFDQYGIDMDTLKEAAIDNLKNDEYHIEKMEKVLFQDTDDSIDEVTELEPGKLYILSNSRNMYGAAGLLYQDLLKKTLKNKDIFIIPSSVHELIMIPADENVDPGELTKMIRSVNETAVKVCDRLSDHPYYYDGQTKQVMCA